MQLKNDIEGMNVLDDVVQQYFQDVGHRYVRKFMSTEDIEWGWKYAHYLLDRKNIFRYGIGKDRDGWLGGIEIAIGPEYFGPADFWSYENSQRFRLGTEIDDIRHNLGLLDEFFGRPGALERAHGFVV